jgi:hypothetical protein
VRIRKHGSQGTGTPLLLLLLLIGMGAARLSSGDEERQRRSLFGIHNLNYGQFEDAVESMEWTRTLVGRGFVFDWVRDGAWEDWIDAAFRLDLVPCIRIQEGTGGQPPSAAHAQTVAEIRAISFPPPSMPTTWWRPTTASTRRRGRPRRSIPASASKARSRP